MILTVILLGVCQVIGFAGLAIFLKMLLDRKQRDIEKRIDAIWQDVTAQPAPDQPSKLALFIDAVGQTLGSAAARSLVASFNADKSHVARVANGLTDQIQAEQNPLLALVAGRAKGKGAALAKLVGVLGPMLTGGGAPGAGPGNNGHQSSVRERLQKGG